jgi:hypothetical protein
MLAIDIVQNSGAKRAAERAFFMAKIVSRKLSKKNYGYKNWQTAGGRPRSAVG